MSSKTLQLLHASAHGKFRTTGRYSAATVRGTIWTVADRCDGTLTHDITDSVAVTDFVHHIIPTTVVDAFAKGDILQGVFVAALYGLALAALGDRREKAHDR